MRGRRSNRTWAVSLSLALLVLVSLKPATAARIIHQSSSACAQPSGYTFYAKQDVPDGSTNLVPCSPMAAAGLGAEAISQICLNTPGCAAFNIYNAGAYYCLKSTASPMQAAAQYMTGSCDGYYVKQSCARPSFRYPAASAALTATDPDNNGYAGNMGVWNAVDGDLNTQWNMNPGHSVYRIIISIPAGGSPISHILVFPATDGTHSAGGMRAYTDSSKGTSLLLNDVTSQMSNVWYSVPLKQQYSGTSMYLEFNQSPSGWQPVIYDIQLSSSPMLTCLTAVDINGDATYGGMDISKLVDNNMGTAWDLSPTSAGLNPRPTSQVVISGISTPIGRVSIWPGDATHAPTTVRVYSSDRATLLASPFVVTSPGSVIQITLNAPYTGNQVYIEFDKTTQWQLVLQELVLHPASPTMMCGLVGSPGCMPAATALFNMYPLQLKVVNPIDGGCTFTCVSSVTDDDLTTYWSPAPDSSRTAWPVNVATRSGAAMTIAFVLIYPSTDGTHSPTGVSIWTDPSKQSLLATYSGLMSNFIHQIPVNYVGSSVYLEFKPASSNQVVVNEIRLSSYAMPALQATDLDNAPTFSGMSVAALVDNTATPWDMYLGGQPWLPSGPHTYRVVISGITAPVEQLIIFTSTDGAHSMNAIGVYSDRQKTISLASLNALTSGTTYGTLQNPSYKLAISPPFLGSSIYVEIVKTVPQYLQSDIWQIIVPEIIVQSSTHSTSGNC